MSTKRLLVLVLDGQTLVCRNSEGLVSDSSDYLYVRAEIPNSFNSYGKTVCFKNGTGSYTHILDLNNETEVPAEVLKAPGFNISMELSDGGGFRLFTNEIYIEVESSGYAPGVFPPPATEDIYDKIVDVVNKNAENINSKADGLSYESNFLQLKSGTKKIGSPIEVSIVNSSGSLINDYNSLTNRPKINGTFLSGDKSLSELGIEARGAAAASLASAKQYTDQSIPTKVSQLENDEGFLDESVVFDVVDEKISDAHNTDEDAHKAIYNEIYSFVPSEVVSGKSTGLTLPSSGRNVLKSLLIKGKGTQNGTPSPLNPVPLNYTMGIEWKVKKDRQSSDSKQFAVSGLALNSAPFVNEEICDTLEIKDGRVIYTKRSEILMLKNSLGVTCTGVSLDSAGFSFAGGESMMENYIWGRCSHLTRNFSGINTFYVENGHIRFKLALSVLKLNAGCTAAQALAALDTWLKAEDLKQTPLRFLYAINDSVFDYTSSDKGEALLGFKTLYPSTYIIDEGNPEYDIEIGYYKDIRDDYAEFKEDFYTYAGYNDDDIVGLEVDYQNKLFKRLAGAVGKNPGSDFNVFPMYGGRYRCTISDSGVVTGYPNNLMFPNYTEDGSNGQVMVYQPKFYYKVVPLKTEPISTGYGYHLRKAAYYISSKPKAGFKLHPAFYDKNGNEVDHIFMSAYEGSIWDADGGTGGTGAYLLRDEQNMNVATDKFCSIAGVKPASGISRQKTEQMAKNRGTDWHCDLIKTASANQLLMIIEMGMMDMQTAVGSGITSIPDNQNYNCSSLTGSTSVLGNATGCAVSTINEINGTETSYTTDGKVSVSYRGMENPWGNIYKFINGINIYGNGSMGGGQPFICSNFNFANDINIGNYTGVGFTITNASGYVSAMGYSSAFDWLFFPTETLGNSSLPVGDYCYATTDLNTHRGAFAGGTWYGQTNAGAFNLAFHNASGASYKYLGGRLVYVPTAQ